MPRLIRETSGRGDNNLRGETQRPYLCFYRCGAIDRRHVNAVDVWARVVDVVGDLQANKVSLVFVRAWVWNISPHTPSWLNVLFPLNILCYPSRTFAADKEAATANALSV